MVGCCAEKMRGIRGLLALTIAGTASADYIQSSFFLSTQNCSGTPLQVIAQLQNCVPQGPSSSLTLHCINSTAAVANVYSQPGCTGGFRSMDVPIYSQCGVQGSDSYISSCQVGTYSAFQLPLRPAPRVGRQAAHSLTHVPHTRALLPRSTPNHWRIGAAFLSPKQLPCQRRQLLERSHHHWCVLCEHPLFLDSVWLQRSERHAVTVPQGRLQRPAPGGESSHPLGLQPRWGPRSHQWPHCDLLQAQRGRRRGCSARRSGHGPAPGHAPGRGQGSSGGSAAARCGSSSGRGPELDQARWLMRCCGSSSGSRPGSGLR